MSSPAMAVGNWISPCFASVAGVSGMSLAPNATTPLSICLMPPPEPMAA